MAPRSPPSSGPEPALVLAGRSWVGDRLQATELGLDEEGRIVRVGRALRGGRRRDLGEAVLLPAGVDLHVHFRDPGPPGSPESFADGTRQAILGGIGVVGDMPNTEPPTLSVSRLEEKAARVRGRAACDVLLYAGLVPGGHVATLGRSAGAFKLYESPTTGIEAPTPPRAVGPLLEAVRATDLAVTVHAEDPAGFLGQDPPPTTLEAWSAARPPSAEADAVRATLGAAGTARVHLAHLTQAPLVEAVRAAGHSCEVTPHHLLLSTHRPGLGAHGKVNPPLRGEADRAALFEAFRQGRVPILASDHAPHAEGAKAVPFDRAPSGMPGVETLLPLLLAKVGAGEVPLPVLQRAACDRPARWMGLPVGRLAPGHRGHVLAVDFRRRTRLAASRLQAPCGWTAFEGFEAVFPFEIYRDGERVVEAGEYVGRPNGRVLRPDYARS